MFIDTSNKKEYFQNIFLILATALIFTFQIRSFFYFTVDDAFMGYRCSKHLAQGYGLVWNREGPPVEGYTNFLWVLIMTLPHYFHWNILLFAKTLGVSSTIGTLCICFRFIQRHSNGSTTPPPPTQYPWAAFGCFLIVLYPSTVVHAVAGLETSLYTFFLTSFFYFFYKWIDHPNKTGAILCGFLAVLLCLTRPEAHLIVFSIGVALFFFKKLRPRLFLPAFVYLIPIFVYHLWRLHYFGHLFSGPFSYNVLQVNHFFEGRYEVAGFLRLIAYSVGPAVFVAFVKLPVRLRPHIVSLGCLLFFYLLTKPGMVYDHRYLYPFFPFLIVLATFGFMELSKLLNISRWSRGMFVCLVGWGVLNLGLPNAIKNANIREYMQHGSVYETIGMKLKALDPTGKSILAVDEIGRMPYYSDWHTIDLFGVYNTTMSYQRAYDVKSNFVKRPDVVILISFGGRSSFRSSFWWMKSYYDFCLQSGEYVLQGVYPVRDNLDLWVFTKPEVAWGKST